jgi:subtilisin family serine protease
MLITGDRVTVSTTADGRRGFTVQAAPRPDGRPVQFSAVSAGAEAYVIPSDAGPGLAAGTLDRQLFNLSTLLRDGQATADRPAGVIVRSGAGTQRLGVAGVPRTRSLRSLNAEAVRPDGAQAATAFWRGLTAAAGAPGARSTAGAAPMVWLDRTVRATLDRSVPQIGAPAAWEQGFDGAGVTVAVLDTGIDPTHPDLTGRVTGEANFTAEPSIVDGHGHGTHVASIIAGSGAASGGRLRGVAPRADLLVGKVLPATGVGPMSQVIAGMEWAAAQGAKVVSMSLSADPTDGTDPASLAVNALSERYGTLFVIATGNSGTDGAVGAPASATAALSVGAVDKSDLLAPYASRGPRRGDAAIKPELTAPGSDIVAARAAGTSMGTPVDARYTTASGTSMATPHVAGAVALLAQAHPDWTAERLKDALVSTATPGDYPVFAGGAGRLDVAKAMTQKVYGPEALDFGAVSGAGSRELTYRNDSDREVTLRLAVTGQGWDGRELPAGAVRVEPATLTVPAGGTATATLSVDGGLGDLGAYAGIVAATADGVGLRSPFSYYKSTLSHALTLRLVTSKGKPADPGLPVWAAKLDGATSPNDPFVQELALAWTGDDGTASFTVADGVYDYYGLITEYDVDLRRSTQASVIEQRISGDTTAVLDARAGRRVNPVLPESTDNLMVSLGSLRGIAGGRNLMMTHLGGGDIWDFYTTPTPPAKVFWMESWEQWHDASSLVSVTANGKRMRVGYQPYFAGPALAAFGDRKVSLVDGGTGTATELAGLRGKVALVRIPIPDGEPFRASYAWNKAEEARAAAVEAGLAGVLIYADVPGAWPMVVQSQGILELTLGYADGDRLRQDLARRRKVTVDIDAGRLTAERSYQVRFAHEGGVPGGPAPRVDTRKLASFPAVYHADRTGLTAQMAWHAFSPRMVENFGLTSFFRMPTEWTEYVGEPGDHLLWYRTVAQTGGFDSGAEWLWQGTRDRFRPGERRPTEHWFESVNHTGAAEAPAGYPIDLRCTFCREGNSFVAGLYRLDSTAAHQELRLGAGVQYRLFGADGTELPRAGNTRFTLPAQPGTYRLEAVETQPGVADGLRTLAPTITTSWNFSSAPVPAGQRPAGYYCPINQTATGNCAAQPLLQIGYGLPLDSLNRSPAGIQVFEVTARAAGGAAVATGLRLWTSTAGSTDGSTAWREAFALPVGEGRFLVLATASGGTGRVSLRAEAWDAAGNRVTQTVVDGYALS